MIYLIEPSSVKQADVCILKLICPVKCNPKCSVAVPLYGIPAETE